MKTAAIYLHVCRSSCDRPFPQLLETLYAVVKLFFIIVGILLVREMKTDLQLGNKS